MLSLNKNPSNGYSSGAGINVSLRYWSGRNLTAAKSVGMLESCAVVGCGIKDPKLVTASEEPPLSSALPVLSRLKFCPGFALALLCV